MEPDEATHQQELFRAGATSAADYVDQELDSVRMIFLRLSALSGEKRVRVLRYVTELLGDAP